MLDIRHLHSAVEMLRGEGNTEWAVKPLQNFYAFRAESRPILPYQSIKRSKIANIFTAVVRRKVEFTGTMQSVLSNRRALEEAYGTRSVDMHILDIVKDMMSSTFLPNNSRAIYTRYTTVAKMTIKYQSMLPFLAKLIKNASAEKFSYHDVDEPSVYVSSGEDIFS